MFYFDNNFIVFLVRRNRRDINLLFCGSKNSLFDYFVGLYEGNMLKEVCKSWGCVKGLMR